MEEEIVRIDDLVRHAKVIKIESTGKVEMGSTVVVEKDGEETKYQIVSPTETNPSEGKISYSSPLGKAMLNKTEGEEFEFETPSKKFKCRVIKII
jgi:transcription elongation factor GreA